MDFTTKIDKFFNNLLKKKEDEEIQESLKFIPSGTTMPSSGFTSDTLKQAIEDAKAVRTASLYNAQQALEEAFHMIKPKSVSSINDDVAEAIEDAKPQIIPTVRPAKEPKPDIGIRFDDVNSFHATYYDKSGMPTVGAKYVKPPALKSHYPQFKRPSDEDLNRLIDSKIGEDSLDDDDLAVLTELSHSVAAPVSGAFQPSLKPNRNTNDDYVFTVTIGNPHHRLLLNCIENSRGELIHFKDSVDVINEAINEFNVNYYPDSITKTILVGADVEYANISLQFDTLNFFDGNIVAIFSRASVVANKGIVDFVKCIKNTVYFYIDGEVFLDEAETKIESMTITGLSYVNPSRMNNGEKFIYLV